MNAVTNMKTGREILSDKEVIDLLLDRTRQQEGILFLYNAYFEQVSRFVIQNSGNEADAQDVFQEVVVSFIYLIQQNKFRGESSIRTFLYSLNRNIWFNELKRRERAWKRETKFEQVKDQQEESVEKSIDRREAGQELLKIINTLGETCKQILLLFYYENYSMKDILQQLDYENEQVVRNKKYKCLKKLEEMMREEKVHQQIKNLLYG